MDVRQWLNNTLDCASPDQEGYHGIADVLRLDTEAPCKDPGPKYCRKRKRASDDSSLIVPQGISEKYPQGNKPAVHRTDEDLEAARSVTRSCVSQCHSSPDFIPVKTYEKRHRHKTKADRYDLKPKKQRKEHVARGGANKSRRRKTHRTGDGERTTGLVQNFQLRNGPKNNRLTLRPELNAGLFKRGRTSVQLPGRGTGLPDLVFNEMRFLQKPKEHQDALQDDGTHKSAAKKNRHNRQDEELSAYFAAAKADSAKHNSRQQVSVEKANEKQAPCSSRQAQPRQDDKTAHVPIDLPDRPFLGFGSKGDRHEDTHGLLASQSYYTWSQSNPADRQPSTRVQALESHPGQTGQLPALSLRQGHPQRPRRERPSTCHEKQPGDGLLSQSAENPRPFESHQLPQSPVNFAAQPRGQAPTSTSQSLPRSSSLQRRFASLKRPDRGSNERRDDGNHTSDILKLNLLTAATTCDQVPPTWNGFYEAEANKENGEPESSSPVRVLLSRAKRAVKQQETKKVALQQAIPYDIDPRQRAVNTVSLTPQQCRRRVTSPPTKRDAHQPALSVEPPPPRKHLEVMDQLNFESNHAAERRRQTAVRRERRHSPKYPLALADPEVERSIDHVEYAGTQNLGTDHVYANTQKVHELVYGLASDHVSTAYKPQSTVLQAAEDLTRVRDGSNRSYFTQDYPGEKHEANVGFEADGDNFLQGFWKPDKLY